jgi:hypothetical protein
MVGGQWVDHPGGIVDYRVNIKIKRTSEQKDYRISTLVQSNIICMWIPMSKYWLLPPITTNMHTGLTDVSWR